MINKIPYHRTLALFTLFCVVLTACTPAPALTATATMPVETPKPSATATASATPTETPDPNAPPGWTRHENGVYFKDVVAPTGETHHFTDTSITNSNGEVIFRGWTESHVVNPTYNDGMPGIDQPADEYRTHISIRYSVKEGMDAPYLRHESNLQSQRNDLTFTKYMWQYIMQRKYDQTRVSISDQQQFFNDFYASPHGIITIPIIDAEGNAFDLPINDQTKVNIILVEPGDFTPDFEVSDHGVNVQSKTIFKPDGSITILTATTKPIDISTRNGKSEFAYLVLGPFFHIITYKDQSQKVVYSSPAEAMRLGTLVEWAIKDPTPHFIIQDTP